MRLKPGVLQWAAVACFCVGLIYALGLEGGAQIGQPITDGEFITAMVLILTSLALGRLSFALGRLRFALENAQSRRQSRYGKINRTHARNTEYPALPEHSSRRDA